VNAWDVTAAVLIVLVLAAFQEPRGEVDIGYPSMVGDKHYNAETGEERDPTRLEEDYE
jgi:hypothetical protein